MRIRPIALAAGCALVLAAVPVVAHHSYSAEFDRNKTITNARNNKSSKRIRISPTDVCISILKFIAHAMHSGDQLIRLQFMAQVADVRINGALITFKRDTVRGIQ